MKDLLVMSCLMLMFVSCNQTSNNAEAEETLPTSRLDAIKALTDSEDTAVINDTINQK